MPMVGRMLIRLAMPMGRRSSGGPSYCSGDRGRPAV